MIRPISFVLVTPVLGTPGGTCGYECTTDSDCSGCGNDGKCNYPHGKDAPYLPTMVSCVDAPDAVPPYPDYNIEDTVWPDQWSADIEAWTYSGWESDASKSTGRYLYDSRYGSKAVYDMLHGQKGGVMQAWNSNIAGSSSKMYLKAGDYCFGFPIVDPGVDDTPYIYLERPDWMKSCHAAGFARYVGREKVSVIKKVGVGVFSDPDTKTIWTDHWSCNIQYEKVNQSITFAQWHALGESDESGDWFPKGAPVRITAGNSQPDPQQSPRMNTVFHSMLKMGEGSSKPADFQWEPNCNPEMTWCTQCPSIEDEAARAFFGHSVRKEHIRSPAFMSRARFAPHAKANQQDLHRAKKPKPGSFFQGSTFQETMTKLNVVLKAESDLTVKPCDDLSMLELHKLQRLLFDARTPELEQIYKDAGDTRSMSFADVHALEKEQKWRAELSDDFSGKAKAGLCHEMVMWFVHHLSADARQAVKGFDVTLPLLPEVHNTTNGDHPVHNRYTEQVSCAICHMLPSDVAV